MYKHFHTGVTKKTIYEPTYLRLQKKEDSIWDKLQEDLKNENIEETDSLESTFSDGAKSCLKDLDGEVLI